MLQGALVKLILFAKFRIYVSRYLVFHEQSCALVHQLIVDSEVWACKQEKKCQSAV